MPKKKNDPQVRNAKLTDYQPYERNHNQSTERGADMIERSFNKYGAGRSILVDKNGKIIAGNQAQGGSLNAGLEDAIEVVTDGSKLVVVRREDLDLDDPEDMRAVELSYVDNRAHEVSFNLDVEQLAADVEAGMDTSTMYTPGELHNLIGEDEVIEEDDLSDAAGTVPEQYVLIVECPDEASQGKLFDELTAKGFQCRALLS